MLSAHAFRRAMNVLVCDLGGTRVKLGLLLAGRLAARQILPAHSHLGLRAYLPALAAAFRGLVTSQDLELGDCDGVAVSFPSLVDTTSGRILTEYGKYRDAPDLDLRAWAKKELGLPLAIENDARMALIGEWHYGAGIGCDDVAMLTVGTGLGTSAVIRGNVLRGKHGQAGCLSGHLCVRYGGRRCNCGNLGCAEAEASSAFLGVVAREHPEFLTSALAREPLLDFAAVFRCAANGDQCALAIRQHSILVWATLMVNLIVAYDPERVIIGGGVLGSADIIIPAIQEFVDRHAPTPWGKVQVMKSALGDAAALMAGEWLLREQLTKERLENVQLQ